MDLEKIAERTGWERTKDYLRGCVDSDNARLYGTFQERAALNTTQFLKIQGSMLVRMGIVYKLAEQVADAVGIPRDAATDLCGIVINYHTWAAGYLAYVTEVQLGLSKYPIEAVGRLASGLKRIISDYVHS
jgi:hypothetical protein